MFTPLRVVMLSHSKPDLLNLKCLSLNQALNRFIYAVELAYLMESTGTCSFLQTVPSGRGAELQFCHFRTGLNFDRWSLPLGLNPNNIAECDSHC